MATKLANAQTDRPALSLSGQVFEITKSVRFEAAHFMSSSPEGHPYRNIHGHSFCLEATIAGCLDEDQDWVEDFSVFTDKLNEIAKRLDHKLLNEIDGLGVPSLERLCVWVANQLVVDFEGLQSVVISRPSLDERCKLVIPSVAHSGERPLQD